MPANPISGFPPILSDAGYPALNGRAQPSTATKSSINPPAKASLYAPAYTRPLFAGKYTPKQDELAWIKQALTGFPAWSSGILGPNYFADQKVEQALLYRITDNEPVLEEIIESIAHSKARVMNTYALYLNQPVKHPQDLISDARNFVKEFEAQVGDIRQILQKNAGFTQKEFSVLLPFLAKTAPILFNMGFADAIKHSSQVAKLAVYKAQEMGASRTDLLQTAMVGWLHDPKLQSQVSWDNMATHPVVASAIADAIFEDPTFQNRLKHYLRSAQSTKSYGSFTRGAVEALSINNDSCFVNENVILKGIIEKFQDTYGEQIAQKLRDLAIKRLESPSKGKKSPPLPQDIVGALRNVRMETGLLGIRKQALAKLDASCCPQVVENIIDGRITDEAIVSAVRQKLRKHDAFILNDVDALTLFSHHHEIIPSGRIAALALVNADPLLLSPHKIIASTPPSVPWIKKLQSFAKSFDSNFNNLPLENQESARPWQRAVYVSVLNAADLLAGRERGTTAWQAADDNLMNELKKLRFLVTRSSTWGLLAKLKTDDPLHEQGYKQLESEYQRMTQVYREAAFQNDSSRRFVI